MTPNVILWVYVVFLLAGGVMGLVKAGSKASLIASTLFAIPLVLCALGYLAPMVSWIVLGVLLVFFGRRLLKGGKFMPAGLMTALSAVTLVLLLIVKR